MEFAALLEAILVFLETYAVELGAGAALLAIVETVFSPFRRGMAKLRGPEKVELVNPPEPVKTEPQPVVLREDAPTEPILKMTLAQFEAKQRLLHDQITAELQTAHDEERNRLQARLDAINERLREPEKALEEAQKRIADLEDRLDREANELGGEKVEEAKNALAELDYSKAEALFEEVRARAQLHVDQAARAEFGLGEIAEARVEWAKAAEHYRRAVGLAPSLDAFFKAQHFTVLSGDYATALPLSERYVELAEELGTEQEQSLAFDRHASLLKSMGRYDEAEPLFRQALEIDKTTIGETHPDYATRLNNLASLLKNVGRYDEAEPLYRQALEIRKAALGETHPDYAQSLNNLAVLYYDMKRYADAEPLMAEALRIFEATLPPEHPSIAASRRDLELIRAKLAEME